MTTYYEQTKRPDPIPTDRQTVNKAVDAHTRGDARKKAEPDPIETNARELAVKLSQIERTREAYIKRGDFRGIAEQTELKLDAIRAALKAVQER